MVITMLVVASVVFLVTNLIPGSVAAVMLGPEASAEDIERLDRQLGMDQPVLMRFGAWLSRLARGDLGVSLYHNTPVTKVVSDRLEPTLLLTFMATTIAVSLGTPLGIVAALHRGTRVDLAALAISLVGTSIPSFWLGLQFILLFGLYLRWLPTSGYVELASEPLLTLQHLIMPAVAVGFSQAGLIARMSRTNLLEVLRTDYVRTARAKGLPEVLVIGKHALRNAMIPTVSVIGVTVTLSLAGAVITESVFAIPGAGRLMVESVLRRDFPVIQGQILLLAGAVAVVNLLVDISYALLNPAVRYE
jgi:peptide/nickel transport system permease protein